MKIHPGVIWRKPNAGEDDGWGAPSGHPLPEGWAALSTGLRGAWLYRVTLPGGGIYWEAEMVLSGQLANRRFASELHARAWLSLGTDPRSALHSLDLEELNGLFRTACLVTAARDEPAA